MVAAGCLGRQVCHDDPPTHVMVWRSSAREENNGLRQHASIAHRCCPLMWLAMGRQIIARRKSIKSLWAFNHQALLRMNASSSRACFSNSSMLMQMQYVEMHNVMVCKGIQLHTHCVQSKLFCSPPIAPGKHTVSLGRGAAMYWHNVPSMFSDVLSNIPTAIRHCS